MPVGLHTFYIQFQISTATSRYVRLAVRIPTPAFQRALVSNAAGVFRPECHAKCTLVQPRGRNAVALRVTIDAHAD